VCGRAIGCDLAIKRVPAHQDCRIDPRRAAGAVVSRERREQSRGSGTHLQNNWQECTSNGAVTAVALPASVALPAFGGVAASVGWPEQLS